MPLQSRQRSWGLLLILFSLCGLAGWTYAQRNGESVDPATLMPAQSILFVKSNGSLLTEDAFKQTATYKSLHESGVIQMLEEAFDSMPASGPVDDEVTEAMEHVQQHGMSLAVTVDQTMQPWGVIVVHDGVGGADLLKTISDQIPPGTVDIQQVQQRGRKIWMTMIANSPVEIGWWEEQGHLLIAVGIDAIHSAIAVADGDKPNLTSSPMYEKYVAADRDFTVESIGWFDFGSLADMFGRMPIPIPEVQQPPTVQQLLEVVGLDSLQHVVMHNGYKGAANWTEQVVMTSGETSGLMELMRQQPMTFSDLPPIPVGQTTIMAGSFDMGNAYDTVWKMIDKAAPFAPAGSVQRAHDEFGRFEDHLGFRMEDLLDSLGHVHCVYTDANQGMFGLGGAIAISVDDADQLKDSLRAFADLVERESRGEFTTQEVIKQERTVTLLKFREAPYLTPALSVGEDWLVLALVPQAIEAFYLREDGKLPRWKPEGQYAEALKGMPEEFTSLTIVDPRDAYRLLMGFVPTLIGAAELGIRESGAFPPDFEMPISPADFPPTEILLEPLFPNVMMSTVDENGVHGYARQSMPGIPFLGGGDMATTAAVTGVAVALLLPAVQQARTAARRTQSANNLKQIMLAMHNYHDVYGNFPRGTIENDELEAEDRLGWLASILPFIEQANLYNMVDMKEGWQADENAVVAEQAVPVLLNAALPANLIDGHGVTHYIGMAGVGEKGPTLPANDPKAGMFAYDRVTRMRDILDGTSNTIAVGETNEPAPWIAGKLTIRPLTKKPYINGGNGFGSPFPGGAQFGLGDGSVRFISENIDAGVMEALSTISGGEVIPQF